MLRGMPRPVAHYRAAPPSANRRHCIAARSRMHQTVYAGLPTGLPMDTVPPSIPTVARMSDAPIAAIELHHVALPTRREHKWTGLTEPIGGYVLVKMIDAVGGAVRRRIPVTHSIGLMAAEEAEREVAQVAKEGIRTIKIKVGVDADRDVDMVRRVRETVGPGIALCVDANQGYRTPGEAIRTYRRMERFELIYFEQPVEGIERLAEVARAIDAPVMADESAWNAHDIIEIIEKRAAQIVSIYTSKPGGLYRAMEVAAVARAAGLRSEEHTSELQSRQYL